MRIERHEADGAALRAADGGAAERLADAVRGLREQPGDAAGWEALSQAFLDHAAVCGLDDPEFAAPGTVAALRSAFQAASAAALLTVHPMRPGSVQLEFTGETVEHGSASGWDAARAWPRWRAAVELSIVAGAGQEDGERLVDAGGELYRNPSGGAVGELLARALFGHVFRAGPDGSVLELTAKALESAVPGSVDARYAAALRALEESDKEAFGPALAALLAAHREASGADAPARALLPMDALTLAVLAVRGQGLDPDVESPYLPPVLVDPGLPVMGG